MRTTTCGECGREVPEDYAHDGTCFSCAADSIGECEGTGDRLHRLMIACGMTAADISERTGMVKSTVYHACSGDRVGDLDTWMKMADAFALPVSVLIGDCDGRQQ